MHPLVCSVSPAIVRLQIQQSVLPSGALLQFNCRRTQLGQASQLKLGRG